MKYKYIPSIDSKDNILKRFTDEEYVSYQIKYRNLLENIILTFIDENSIMSAMKNIPKCNDQDYNFYHTHSIFENGYLYIRNNIHIERLDIDELEQLKDIDMNKEYISFINKTLFKVISEEEKMSCYGTPISENIVNSYALVFELAYDRTNFDSIDQIKQVDTAYKFIKDELNEKIKKVTKIDVELVKYSMMPNLYVMENTNKDKKKVIIN